MFDIKELKDKIVNGGIALNEPLEKRVLNDELTEKDYEFLKKAFGTIRDLKPVKLGR